MTAKYMIPRKKYINSFSRYKRIRLDTEVELVRFL
jgi:hypothetical protein